MGELADFSKGSGYSKGDLTSSGTPIILYGRLYTKYETVIEDVDTFVDIKDKAVMSSGGEVIVPSSGETAEDISRASVVGKSGIILGGDLNIVKPDSSIDPAFLAITISNGNQQKELSKRAQGKSVVHISNSDLKDVALRLPTLSEQSSISSFFRTLDNTITLHKRKLDGLKVLKNGYMQQMFPQSGEDVPRLRFAGFAGKWVQHKFGDILREKRELSKIENEDVLLSCAINGMFLNTELFGRQRGASNIGYVKIKKGDLILSAQNLHLGNANVNLRFDSGIISPAYKVFEVKNCNIDLLASWIKMDSTKDFFLKATTEGASVCRKNIEWGELMSQRIKLPDFKEQEMIGRFLSTLDRRITTQANKVDKLKRLKAAYLQQMLL